MNCITCGKEYTNYMYEIYNLKGDCDKCYMKKYCPHNFELAIKYIKNYRSHLQNAPEEMKQFFRKLLRDEQAYQKTEIRHHKGYCIGDWKSKHRN